MQCCWHYGEGKRFYCWFNCLVGNKFNPCCRPFLLASEKLNCFSIEIALIAFLLFEHMFCLALLPDSFSHVCMHERIFIKVSTVLGFMFAVLYALFHVMGHANMHSSMLWACHWKRFSEKKVGFELLDHKSQWLLLIAYSHPDDLIISLFLWMHMLCL